MDQVKCDESLQMHCREWKESLTAMMSENDTCFIAKEQRAATESQVLSYGNNKKVSALKRLSLCVFRSLLGA